jgi:hypothetical protein
MLNETDLRRIASESGFRPDALEKVLRLFELRKLTRAVTLDGSEAAVAQRLAAKTV